MPDAEWKQRLPPAAYDVLRHEGTEHPGSSPLNDEHRKGTFVCAGCDLPLFTSTTKFESGTGWPSFYASIPGAREHQDRLQDDRAAHRVPLRALRRPPGPRLRRRPAADRQALLQQRRGAEVRRRLALSGRPPRPSAEAARLRACRRLRRMRLSQRRARFTRRPTLDPSDPMAREAQTFPQPERRDGGADRALRQRGALRGTDAPLFSRGERSVDFFFVLEGSIEIFDRRRRTTSAGLRVLRERPVHRRARPVQRARRSWSAARAGAASRVVRIKRADFRRLVTSEPDIGEIIMRAFILRRVGLIRHAQGGVVAGRPGAQRRHPAPAAVPDPQRLSASPARHRARRRAPAASSSASRSRAAELPVVIAAGRPRAAQPDARRARRRPRA